ncbi:MAG: cytochrome c biogenesis protein ResB [Nitrospirae bacterium]|nr:cytochrome c biogenesis protein ResB [Nitrospirota bacterium]MBI3378324.1 cytochrome c biogenesis protein ResB [Nitrospirota bacterium]
MKEVKLLNDVHFFTTITRPKFVITLIILILIATFIGVLVPQVSYKSPSYFETWKLTSPKTFYIVNFLQLNRVYASAWFLLLVFIIMLSLGYSIYLQVKRNLKRKDFIAPDNVNWDAVEAGAVVTGESLIKFMKKKRYALKNRSEGLLAFSKHSINRWGGVIFHSGLFLIIIAALIGLAFQKRGFVQVMEGEVFSGSDSDFLVKYMGLFSKRFDTGFKIHLSGFQHTYWDTGDIKSLESSVAVTKGDTTADYNISVNSPLNINGVKIYQSSNYGYVLSFLLKSSTGKQVVTHFLLDRPDRIGRPAIGRSDFATTDYIFDMKFYPDITKPSFYPSKPILYLRVIERETPVFEGLLMPGQAIKVKNDILLFAAIRSWSGLIFAKNIGTNIAYAGFVIAITGMIINYLLPYKEIQLGIRGDSVISISGSTKRYHAMFEEELSNIKAELGVSGDG